MNRGSWLRAMRGLAGASVLLVASCATYHPQALATAPDLAAAPVVTVPASRLDLPGLQPHPVDPAGPWDETAVATLAVLHNPELKAARLEAGVADAQVLDAGLLPDPVVSAGRSRSPAHRGYSVGLEEEIAALVTRSARRGAAEAHVREVNLTILWQEWQVAARARDLFLQAEANRRLQVVLVREEALRSLRYRADAEAMRRGDLTAVALAGDLAAWHAAAAEVNRLQLAANQTDHELTTLLGLAPGTVLRLGGGLPLPELSPEDFRSAVSALPNRRADLLALRAAYESQEQRLRAAVLAEFPALSVGVEQARSAEEGVHTVGVGVSLTLPVFNRNRGRIAIERATRAALGQAYQARLDQTAAEADRVWQATRIMTRQLRDLEARLSVLRPAAAAAGRNFQDGALALDAYAALVSSSLAAEAGEIRLQSSLARAQAALQTLLGMPLGDGRGPPDATSHRAD